MLVTLISFAVCVAVVLRFLHDTYDIANEMLDINEDYSQLSTLRPGTLFPSRQIDRSDHQWAIFVSKFPYLALIGIPVSLLAARWGRSFTIVGVSSLCGKTLRRFGGKLSSCENNGGDDIVVDSDHTIHQLRRSTDSVDVEKSSSFIRSLLLPFTLVSSRFSGLTVLHANDPSIDGAFAVRGDRSREMRSRFLFAFGMVMAFLLLGVPFVFPLAMCVVNYWLTRSFSGARGSFWFPWVIWTVNLAFMVYSDYTSGFSGLGTYFLGEFLAWRFSFPGIVRWHVYSRFVVLRCISFAIDCHWARLEAEGRKAAFPRDDEALEKKPLYYRLQERPRPLHEYGLKELIGYVFYFPLFMAGPITTFNAFAGQMGLPPGKAVTRDTRGILLAMARILLYVLAVEVILHFNYSNAIVLSGQYSEFSGWECWCAQYSILKFMWLKFLIIWRFFRLWAALDGVEVPENMSRCMSNHRRFTSFWRGWHASFNIYNIRYIFLPLGGRKRQVALLWLIFIFVALWHEISMKWLSWGVYTSIFFSIEVIIVNFFQDRIKRVPGHTLIVAFVSTFAIAALMFSNMAIMLGFEETIEFTRMMYFNGWSNGFHAFGMTAVYYTAAAMLMMKTREIEKLDSSEVQKKRT